MKRLLLASLSLVAITAAVPQAMAADLGVRQPMPVKAPAYAAPYYNWTGFYIGINGGYGFGNSRWSAVGNSFDTNGGLVGGTLGYNWQVGQAVLGLEGDGDWANIKGSTSSSFGTIQTQSNWLSTVRGRLGYAGDRWMPYATAGAAFGDIKASLPGFTGTDTTRAGWTAGAGVEFAISGPWTAKLEYLYVDLGNANTNVPVSPDNVSLKENIVRAGVNYRF
jgi:outer membrane immunogenic protein